MSFHNILDEKSIKDNIDFILSHFKGQHELFPRTIMTFKTKGQLKIEYESDVQRSKDKIFDYFKEAEFTDCKINAFPYNTEHTLVDLDVKNKTAATFIMIDIDLKDFEGKNKEMLENQLKRTLNKLFLKFRKEAHPTVLWTGNGYHIYQPLDGVVFEKFKEFYEFLPYLDGRDLTTEFLRFAEKFFTDGRSDPQHLPSIKSCLVRIPGTINSKNGEMVRIIQKWDGNKPHIQWITEDFMFYLIQKKIDKIEERKIEKEREKKLKLMVTSSSFNKPYTSKIRWIENLFQTPIEDYRKYCLWRIIIPYLVNVRKLSNDEAYAITNDWLQKCNDLKKLDFNPNQNIKSGLRHVKNYLPVSKETLRKEQAELYRLFEYKNIISSESKNNV